MAIDPTKFKIDPKKAKPEEIETALALLEKKRVHEARVKAGEIKGYAQSWRDMSPEQKAKMKKYNYRRMIRQSLLISKAVAAGYVISDKEVDAEINRRAKEATVKQ